MAKVKAELDDIQEDLKQAIDILKEQVKKSHQSGNAMFFKEAIEGIPEFDGSTVPIKKWLQEIDDNAIIFGWTDLHTLVVAKKLLTGVAKLWLRSQPTFSTWPELKEAITNEFDNPIDKKKQQFESYYEYFLNMREFGSQGNLEEAVIIQYVINGIPDQEFNKSILYGSTSYSVFKIKFKNYERIKSKTNSTTSKVIPKPIDDKESKCFNCGKRGHLSRECRFKDLGKKCFSFNSFGHIANQCPTRRRMFKVIKINDHELQALIDTGSQLNLIRIDRYLAIGSPNFDADDRFILALAINVLSLLGKFKAEVKIDDVLFVAIFNIVPEDSMKVEVIIGDEMLKEVHFSVVGDSIQIKPIQDDWIGQIGDVFHTESCPLDLAHITDPQLTKDILSIQKNYNPEEIKTTSIETKIILKTEVPLYQHSIRLGQKEAQEVDAQIDEWLKQGIIQKSNSENASPIVLVKKRNGKTRICVDYRKLNKETVKDRYPLPLIEDQIDKLQAARHFSTIDLKNGFFHFPVAEDSRKLTSFVVPNGQYEFLKTPFGLCNAQAKFQRFINSIFAEEIQKGIVLTYLDDIVIPANDAEEALRRLKHVLKRDEEYGLQINWEKCQRLKSEITYLGHEIKDGVIRPSDDKVAAVKRFPELKTIKQLQSFLGLTAKPLSDMLKTNANFMMGPDQKQAFQDLKHILTSKPVSKIYQVGARTELHTDASKFGFGAILLQKTNEAQQKYSSYELEVLAVVEAVKKFRVYLLGIKFKILTECSAFTITLKKKDLTTRVARWALLLEEYDYTIEHSPGSGMKHVDALSRNPVSMMIQTDTLVEKIRNAQGRDPLIKALLETWKARGNVAPNLQRLTQGTALTSNDFKEYCKEESIEHCCITTGVLRGNGQLERINCTIVSVLTKLSIDNPQEWHKHVRKLQKALNSTHQRSIRMSPFEILFRVKMRKEDLRLLEMIEELASTFDEERDQKRKAAKQEILNIQEENRNTFNKKRKKAFVYKEGALVVIQKSQFATKSKLYPKYIGPHKVIKIKPNDQYNVEKFADFEGPNRTSCRTDLMKPWFTQDEYPSELSGADEVQDSRIHSLKLVNNWQTFELTNISDHVTVSFDINVNLDITNNQQKSTWKFSEKKADWSLFSTTISKQEVRRLENDIKKVEKDTDIDMVVDRLTDIIQEAAHQSLEVKSSNFNFDTGIKWWNKELEQKKKYFHYVRNLYFHHKAISVNEYKSVNNKYKNSIRKAKRNSWRNFIEENGSNNPFGNAYKTLKKLSSSNQQKGLPIIEQAPVDSKETNKRSGYFPKKWKTAALKIIAKPNKTNYESAKSYRPISLLSNFSKILEKILKNKIYEFYIQNNLLSSRQHRFIKSKSTITALNTIIDVLMEHKQKELSALVTIDISGAFDNAWWPAIIKRIDSDNLPEKLIKILQSYLNSRIISFSYDNLTTSKPITKGCPQGSPLSPLLWTILLNDLLMNFQVPNCELICYADDISVICWNKDLTSLKIVIEEALNTYYRIVVY
ncbi:hypothetical protein LAZ67_12000152 [Cordylochernes scorpioides]|uniref:RNA-directed DNA polymerase n=1 Tax=Cordylochernes scorpioides TaxID=51811 RepID=A0ABY6L547_9ARAC|nr:hypothetical protein LAZ67_12000152 [Cordylochernes scorpioides]